MFAVGAPDVAVISSRMWLFEEHLPAVAASLLAVWPEQLPAVPQLPIPEPVQHAYGCRFAVQSAFVYGTVPSQSTFTRMSWTVAPPAPDAVDEDTFSLPSDRFFSRPSEPGFGS